MFGDLADFVHSRQLAGPGLVAELVPRFDTGQQDLESAALEPLQMRLRQERQAAFRDEIDPTRRYRRVDRVQVVIESNPEVRVVPADPRPLQSPGEEPQVLGENTEVERLIRDDRIDTKAAGVGTSQAADHRHDLEQRGLPECRLDEPPTFAHPGKRLGLPLRRQMCADRPVRRAVSQHFSNHGLVCEPDDIVEILPGVLRVAARVGPAESGDGSPRSEQVGERVGEQGRFRKRADEDEIDLCWQLLDQVLETRVADERGLVPFRFAPHPDDLGHDAGHVRVHDARVERAGRPLRDQIDDADAKLTHRSLLFYRASCRLTGTSYRL